MPARTRLNGLRLIGKIGVDAGLCYVGDPCYFVDRPLGRGTWEQFLDSRVPADEAAAHWEVFTKPAEASTHTFPAGVLVTTGDGDGEYPVYAEVKDGRVRRIVIDFG